MELCRPVGKCKSGACHRIIKIYCSRNDYLYKLRHTKTSVVQIIQVLENVFNIKWKIAN